MNFVEKLKKTSRRWNCFSKSDVLGSFDFMTLVVSLESLRIDDFNCFQGLLLAEGVKKSFIKRELQYDQYLLFKKFFGLAYHEYTHFIDTTSTVWGLHYLVALNNAYLTNHDLFGTRESEYYKAKSFHDLARSLKLPDYYTAVTPNVDYARPWSYQITAGKKFDSDGVSTDIPIFFVSFGNSNNERIVRSPLSIIAILEVSAMAQEFLYKGFLVDALSENDRCIEQSVFQNESLDLIYNHNLTEYTVCAHLVANTHHFTDVFKTYRVCEKISTIVLNFTDANFSRIKLSDSSKKTLSIYQNSSLERITNNALKHKDRGYLFYLICFLMPSSQYEDGEDIVRGIGLALNGMGLDYNTVIRDAREEVESCADTLRGSSIKSISGLSSAFLKNFDQKIKAVSSQYNFSLFDLPPVLLGDCEVVSASPGINNSLKDYDINASYDELVLGQLWVERFSEACI